LSVWVQQNIDAARRLDGEGTLAKPDTASAPETDDEHDDDTTESDDEVVHEGLAKDKTDDVTRQSGDGEDTSQLSDDAARQHISLDDLEEDFLKVHCSSPNSFHSFPLFIFAQKPMFTPLIGFLSLLQGNLIFRALRQVQGHHHP